MRLDAITNRLRDFADVCDDKSNDYADMIDELDIPSYRYGYWLATANTLENIADQIDEIIDDSFDD